MRSRQFEVGNEWCPLSFMHHAQSPTCQQPPSTHIHTPWLYICQACLAAHTHFLLIPSSNRVAQYSLSSVPPGQWDRDRGALLSRQVSPCLKQTTVSVSQLFACTHEVHTAKAWPVIHFEVWRLSQEKLLYSLAERIHAHSTLITFKISNAWKNYLNMS